MSLENETKANFLPGNVRKKNLEMELIALMD